MPNRIIKESAFTSDRIAKLSDFEFRLWIGLITQADDAGRGDARPAIIKGRVFALRERVTIKDINSAIHALAAAGCVSLYKVGGMPYYAFPSWSAHQRIRDCKPKYPGMDEADEVCGNPPQVAASCRELPPESNPIRIQSESESKGVVRFAPPTLEEVRDYCADRGYAVDPERFVAYYQSNGWMVGKNKMRDWKAAVRNWESRESGQSSGQMRQRQPGKNRVNPPTPGTLSEIEQNAIRKMLDEEA